MMENSVKKKKQEVVLKPVEATADNFKEYGQLIKSSPDGAQFGPQDAQLDLSHGTPRFYIINLEGGSLKWSRISHHASVTQCLGSIGGHVWYLGVAKPSIVRPDELTDIPDEGIAKQQSRSGHFYIPPAVEDVCIFRISGPKFIKLDCGTWHAGPLFKDSNMDFYNLELSNTNAVDLTTHNFIKENDVVFSIDD